MLIIILSGKLQQASHDLTSIVPEISLKINRSLHRSSRFRSIRKELIV